MNNIAISVENMSKDFKVYYDKAGSLKEKMMFWKRNKSEIKKVLKNINLEIEKGETVALIGTNGCGKSTLLKLMTKIIYPTKGKIKVNGTLTSLLELGAGFHPDFTGRENIYFNASIFGLTRKEIDNRIDDIIEFSELGEFIDNPIRTYSSGMYMRLAFSIAINVDADILLIDEILAVGDQHFTDKCFKKLEELRDSDKTIVIVSHSLDQVKRLCKRAIWIYDGEVKLDGEPSYVIDKYLDRIASDHKENKRKKIESGEEDYNGEIWIDDPKNHSTINIFDKTLKISGWDVSDCENSKLKLKINDKYVEKIKRIQRIDVFEAFCEKYEGFLDPEKLGWEASIEPKKYIKDQDKELNIVAELYSEKKLITTKQVNIYVNREEK